MTHQSSLAALATPRVFLAAAAVAVIALAAGCGSAVGTGGGDGEGGDNGGGGGGGGDDSVENECDSLGTVRSCDVQGGPPASGSQTCAADENGFLSWSACQEGGSAASTPLVLSFDGAPIQLAAGEGSFDLTGTMSVTTDWPSAAAPWLALDRDGSGAIEDGRELFGSATVLNRGERAQNGFEALAELDSNGDGRITRADAAWSSLRMWSDGDGDRVSSARELSGLDARGVAAIDLGYSSERRCDARGNCEIERSTFEWSDENGALRTGAIVDVHLKHR